MRLVAHVLVPSGALRARPGPQAGPAAARRRGGPPRPRRPQRRGHGGAGPRPSHADVTLKGEQLGTGAVGFTVQPFADAVFALQHEGEVSGVVETRFGFHVIFLKQILPARKVPFEQVAAELRAGVWPDFRRREFARFVDALIEKHKVELRPDASGRARDAAASSAARAPP